VKKIKVEFTDQKLTGNAGLVQVGQFAKKLDLENILESHISIQRGANAEYSIPDAVMMLTMGALAGVKHMSHMAMLGTDSVIPKLFGWDSFPDASTFGRLFRLFNHNHCNELSNAEDNVRKKVWSNKWFGRLTLDLDSSVKGVYGSQEGAATGYNPDKKGQKSYHPLFCFISQTRECLHNWFRTGDAYSANGAVEFAKECFSRLPKRVWKVTTRGDSAFFNGKLLDFLESRSSQYLIKVKMRGLVDLLMKQKWRQAHRKPGYETTEFEYKCHDWEKARRFVAVRKIVKEETEGLLFPVVKYEFFCYVTNLDLTPWEAHKFYCKRATCENLIEWCKNQMAAGNILTQEFWANSAIFQTCILAYNLLAWMMWLTTKKGFREEPNTIRSWLIRVPARLISSGRQWILKLPQNYFFKEQWEHIECSIFSLCFG
jgi:hypothetical protein